MCQLPSIILHLKTKHDWVANSQNHEEAWNYDANVLIYKMTLLQMRRGLSFESCPWDLHWQGASVFPWPRDPACTVQDVSSMTTSRFNLHYSGRTQGKSSISVCNTFSSVAPGPDSVHMHSCENGGPQVFRSSGPEPDIVWKGSGVCSNNQSRWLHGYQGSLANTIPVVYSVSY